MIGGSATPDDDELDSGDGERLLEVLVISILSSSNSGGDRSLPRVDLGGATNRSLSFSTILVRVLTDSGDRSRSRS